MAREPVTVQARVPGSLPAGVDAPCAETLGRESLLAPLCRGVGKDGRRSCHRAMIRTRMASELNGAAEGRIMGRDSYTRFVRVWGGPKQ